MTITREEVRYGRISARDLAVGNHSRADIQPYHMHTCVISHLYNSSTTYRVCKYIKNNNGVSPFMWNYFLPP